MCYHSRPDWTWEDGNEGVLCIPQSSIITEASSLDCLVSYLGRSLGKSYSSAEKQSVYILRLQLNGPKRFYLPNWEVLLELEPSHEKYLIVATLSLTHRLKKSDVFW